MEGRDLKLVASKIGRLYLEKIKLYGNSRRKLIKAWANQGSIDGVQYLSHTTIPTPW
jgi:hypothetical protein